MTDEELKLKAEKVVTKLAVFTTQVMGEAINGMTEDERSKFMVYYLAAGEKVSNVMSEDFNGLDKHELIDTMTAAYEMVYELDQKPEWDS